MSEFHTRNQRLTNTVGHLELLEITNPSFSGPMRVVNDVQDCVSQGVSYIGIPFGFTLPEDVGGSAPRLKLAMDNVGRGVTDELERRQAGTITMARLILARRDTPDVHEHVYWLPLTQVVVDGATAQATASADEITRAAACKQIANPFTTPGIF